MASLCVLVVSIPIRTILFSWLVSVAVSAEKPKSCRLKWKVKKDVRSYNSRKLKKVEGGRCDAVCQDNNYHNSLVEAAVIVLQGFECMLERYTRFVTELVDILLRVKNQRDQRIASELISLLTDTSFEINVRSRRS